LTAVAEALKKNPDLAKLIIAKLDVCGGTGKEEWRNGAEWDDFACEFGLKL